MKFSIDAAQYRKTIPAVARAAATRNVNPALTQMVVLARRGVVTFSSTDAEVFVECDCRMIEGVEVGAVCVPAGLLSATANMAGDLFKLEWKDGHLNVHADGGEFRIRGSDDESNFPNIATPDAEAKGVKSAAFLRAMECSRWAVGSGGKTGPAGIVLRGGKKLELFATNCNAMTVATVESDCAGLSCILPPKFASLVGSFAWSEDVDIRCGGSFMVSDEAIRVGTLTLEEKQIPPFDVVANASLDGAIELGIVRESMVDALVLLSTFSDETDYLKLSADEGDVFLLMEARDFERGGSSAQVNLARPSPGKIESFMSRRYLLAAVRAMECENVEAHFRDGKKPSVFKDGTGYQAIISPAGPQW